MVFYCPPLFSRKPGICRSSVWCSGDVSKYLFNIVNYSCVYHNLINLFSPTCPLNAVFQSYAHTPSIAPDDDVFRHLSLVYSNNHAKMSRGVSCKSGSPRFEQGITNGAAWYPLTGKFHWFYNICTLLFQQWKNQILLNWKQYKSYLDDVF